jgi:hypothetical protein
MVSLGPKTYSLQIIVPNSEPVYVTKMKGITLRHNNAHLTDFKTMKNLVDGNLQHVSIKIVNNIVRSPDFKILTTASSEKKVRLVYNKRKRTGVYDTKPWGHRADFPPVVPDMSIRVEDWEERDYFIKYPCGK